MHAPVMAAESLSSEGIEADENEQNDVPQMDIADDDDDDDGDEEGGAGGQNGGEAPPELPMSDERRDRVVLRLLAFLVAGLAVSVIVFAVGSALGWIRPICGGVFVTQTTGCTLSAPATNWNAPATPSVPRGWLIGVPTTISRSEGLTPTR